MSISFFFIKTQKKLSDSSENYEETEHCVTMASELCGECEEPMVLIERASGEVRNSKL